MMKLIKKENTEGIYLIEGVPYFIVNVLRNIIIEEIPTLRIEEVTVYKNYSHLYDEMLAHRLGLLVIKPKEKRDEFVLYLQEKGPKMVYAKDIKGEGVEILYKDTPIVYLKDENQEIHIEMKARFGIGRDHIKFKPAHVWYKFYPEIIQKKDLDEKGIKLVKEKLPEIYEIKDKKLIIKEEAKYEYDLGGLFYDKDLEEYFEYKPNKEKIIFYIDNFQDYSDEELIKKAKEIFLEKIKKFDEIISKW